MGLLPEAMAYVAPRSGRRLLLAGTSPIFGRVRVSKEEHDLSTPPYSSLLLPPSSDWGCEIASVGRVVLLSFDDDWFASVARSCEALTPEASVPLRAITHPDLRFALPSVVSHLQLPVFAHDAFVEVYGRLVATCFLWGRPEEPKGRGPRLSPQALRSILASVERRLDGPISIGEIAREHDLSPSYLSRSFRGSTGQTLQSYVLDRRVAATADLLLETDQKLSEVALAAGFSSQAHMTSVFSEQRGTPPGLFRARHRSKDGSTRSNPDDRGDR